MEQSFTFKNQVVSASPNFVTIVLNKSGELEQITSVVVLYPFEDEMDIYRKSTSAPSIWSRDVYKISVKKRIHKDKQAVLPLVPNGAFTYRIRNIEFSSMVEVDRYFLDDLVRRHQL